MSFPEPIRVEALKKSHFMCVACHSPFVEVHHIIPEGEGGPNTLDNAAPLCPGCHGVYGANPVFRKQIRQMRDNWFDVCERRFGPLSPSIYEEISHITDTLKSVRDDQKKYQTTIDQIKQIMMGSLNTSLYEIKSAKTFEEVATASSAASFMR
jgi:hypothetical protein